MSPKQLGYTLAKLNQGLTFGELLLWSTYFDLLNEEHDEELKKRRGCVKLRRRA